MFTFGLGIVELAVLGAIILAAAMVVAFSLRKNK